MQPKNPLHGLTLEHIVSELVAFFGWEELGQRIDIRCFTTDPSIPSSLKFLRKTPWARQKTEGLYLFMIREKARRARRAAAVNAPVNAPDGSSTEGEPSDVGDEPTT